MKEEKIKTLFELFKANKSFSCALNKGVYPEHSNYIMYELIFIYFNTNISLLREYDISTYDFICNLFRGADYYIEGDVLHTKDNTYPLSYFMDLINRLEEYRNRSIVISRKKFFSHHQPSSGESKNDCKIYVLNDYRKLLMYEMSERELVFQYTTRVDEITKPYIDHVMSNFKRFINYVVINILKGNIDKIPIKELEVLSAYINMFPLFGYGQDLVDFPYERLLISSYEIGVAKITYDNKEIVDINRKYNRVRDKIEQLSYQEALAVGSELADSQMLNRVRRKISLLKKDEIELLYQLYEMTHLEHIYNPTLLKSVWESFLSNSVDINTLFNNPVLRLFTIKDDVTKFYSAMHLDTLTKLIDNDMILEILKNEPRLLLTN